MQSSIFQPLTKLLTLLPSIGPKNARRIAITLAKEPKVTEQIINHLIKIQNNIKNCAICNNLTFNKICNICEDHSRNHDQICIVSDISNLLAIENIHIYDGVFHVLENINIMVQHNYIEDELIKRITGEPQEFILALNPTIEGQATIHYIQSVLKNYKNIVISSLSLGMPIGSDLDYLDSGTITIAFESRKEI